MSTSPIAIDIAVNVRRAMGDMTRRELGAKSGLGKKRVKQILDARDSTVTEMVSLAGALGIEPWCLCEGLSSWDTQADAHAVA